MMLKHIRLLFLIAWEYFKRKKIIFLAGFISLLVIIGIQVKFNFLTPQNTIRIGLIGTYQEHDLPIEALKLVSDSLVEASSDARIKPVLVTGWEVNHDATEFKFKLKDDLTWIDNTKVKCSDLIFTIPNTTASCLDDKTIQFNLTEAYSPLPSLLTRPIFKKGTLLGTGPYKITNIEKSRIFITKIILKSINPKLPVISIRFYPNEKVAITGFNLGEVQVLMGLSNPKALLSNPLTVLKTSTDYTKIVSILFQTTDPLLRVRSLRQALAYQAPKIPGLEVANNPYPSTSWAYDETAKKYLDNKEEATTALERGKSQLPDNKLNSELILTTTPYLGDTGKPIVEAWKNLGFDAKLRVEEGIPQNFQALLITQSIPSDPDQYFLWHATQTKTNLTKYDSKRADKDLEDGRKIIEEGDRQAKYFDFQKTLLEDAPAVFLYFPKYNIVYLKKAEINLEKVLSLETSVKP